LASPDGRSGSGVRFLIYLTFNLPIVIWIVTDQFRGIPHDLDEAARLEGASQFTVMTRICLPLAMPAGRRPGWCPGGILPSRMSSCRAVQWTGPGHPA